ncbi:hypothetical protein C3F09_12560 [candidate division GN15 bacterium]|uniref:Sigma-54-dependent Fis family transcriptional regulator n=1 Tax=candidate division GN15 bacterium TaxID=2072418 RepID=A0A855X2P6_9BACT|nr:MAG: hypothetical protein C3F09_12560 [candidate division GN15 bacterium]
MTDTSKPTILVVDDDPRVLDMLVGLFCDEHLVLSAGSGAEAIRIVEPNDAIAATVMDIKMSGMDGITTAREFARLGRDIPIIFHTGYPGEYDEYAIDQNEKPFDYVQKGKSAQQLIRSVRNATESFQRRRDIQRLALEAESAHGMVGRSAAMLAVYEQLRKAAASNARVMILGETGTGKELVARAIHRLSTRSDKRLAIFNCNHKSSDLVESELFGHLKGAFTGATADRVGLFEYAHGGTVFLDEIGDLDITTQAKLLRVLETGEFQRLGAPEVLHSDTRLICATHKNLEQMVKEERFRSDLYYRLRGIEIKLPPLRDRREDIPAIISRLLDCFTVERDMPPMVLEPGALHALVSFDWPGNVRQLRTVIEALVTLTDSAVILESDVMHQLTGSTSGVAPSANSNSSLAERMRGFRRTCIIEALHTAGGNISEAARLLGMDRSNLRKEIIDLQIPLG